MRIAVLLFVTAVATAATAFDLSSLISTVSGNDYDANDDNLSATEGLKCCDAKKIKEPKDLSEEEATKCESLKGECLACVIRYSLRNATFQQHCLKKDDDMHTKFDKDMMNLSGGIGKCRYHYEEGNEAVICSCDKQHDQPYCNSKTGPAKDMSQIKASFDFNPNRTPR